MVLDSKRAKVDFILTPMANALTRFSPNSISGMSLVIAFLAALATFYSPDHWQILLPLAAVLVLVSGLFDALDGKVARLTGKTSKRGDFLDHVLDRYADVFMIGAVAAITGTAILLYANRPECETDRFAGGCGYGTKVVGGAVLSGGIVGLFVGALTWR